MTMLGSSVGDDAIVAMMLSCIAARCFVCMHAMCAKHLHVCKTPPHARAHAPSRHPHPVEDAQPEGGLHPLLGIPITRLQAPELARQGAQAVVADPCVVAISQTRFSILY